MLSHQGALAVIVAVRLVGGWDRLLGRDGEPPPEPRAVTPRGDLAEEVARIKGEPGGDVIAYGGYSLAQSLSR